MFYLKRGLQSAEAIGNIAECAYYHIGVSDHCLYRHDTKQYADEEERLRLLHRSVEGCREALQMMDTINGRMVNGYRLNCCENLSRTFCLMQQYDSCVYYGEMVLIVLGDVASKFLLKNLYQSYKALGDEENTARISERLLNLPDDNGAEQKALTEVKDEYDHHLELQRVESEQQVKRYRLYLWIALLTVGLMTVLWFTFRYRKNKELEALRLQEESLRLQSANERMSHEASENLLRRVNQIYRSHESDAYRHILAEFNSVYPQAISNLKTDHPDLTDAEIGVCLLSFLSFRVKEIGDILGFKENTISKYRAYIRSKTDIEVVEDVLKGYVVTEDKGVNP
jgi:DNA-binding CsgD family transcriptional regulator